MRLFKISLWVVWVSFALIYIVNITALVTGKPSIVDRSVHNTLNVIFWVGLAVALSTKEKTA